MADDFRVWKAPAADASAAPQAQTGLSRVIKKRGKTQTKHVTVSPHFGSFRTYFRVHGSAIFHRSVVVRSLFAAGCAEAAYFVNR